MLLFNLILQTPRSVIKRFNTPCVVVQRFNWVKTTQPSRVSIHHVLLFNSNTTYLNQTFPLFQYTMCCCSTLCKIYRRKCIKFQYTMCCCSTEGASCPKWKSFLFQYTMCCCSTNFLFLNSSAQVFQYTMCCCSTITRHIKRLCLNSFNTPCVVVQR